MQLLYVERSENLLLEYNLTPENLLAPDALIQQSSQEPSLSRSNLDSSNASSRRLRKNLLYLLFHLFRWAIPQKLTLQVCNFSNFAVLWFYLSFHWIIKPLFLSCRRKSRSPFSYMRHFQPLSCDEYNITLLHSSISS